MRRRWAWYLFLLFTTGFALWYCAPWLRIVWNLLQTRMSGPKTVEDRLCEFGPAVERRLKPFCNAAGVPFPPSRLALLGLKREKRLEVYAAASDTWKLLRAYPILAASGVAGPKQREGDRQVPEGLYRIESLNPNSRFHLALRVNYPNEFDRRQAQREGRSSLGGDIMIHGNEVSVGCLAMGDEAAEDLFVPAARTGLEQIQVILAPCDLRITGIPPIDADQPPWLAELYEQLMSEMKTIRHEEPLRKAE